MWGRSPGRPERSPSVLVPDEGRRVRQEKVLAIRPHGEKAAHDGPAAAVRAAVARPAIVVERIQPVVDRDLLSGGDRAPGEHLDAVAHRIRVAGVIEVAPGRSQHPEPVEVELAQVVALPRREPGELALSHDATVATPQYELADAEAAPCEHARPLRTGVAYLDVSDHPITVEGRPAGERLKSDVA